MPGWLRSLMLGLGLAIAVGGLLWFGWHGELEKGGSFAAAGILLMLASRFDHLASIKVAGIEAKLERKLAEADQIMNHVRQLALGLSDPLLRHAFSSGRYSSALNLREAAELQANTESLLRQMGIDENAIAPLRRHHRYYALIDICAIVASEISKAFQEQDRAERQAIADRFGSPVKDLQGYNAAWAEKREKERRRDEILRLLSPTAQPEFKQDPDAVERLLKTTDVLPQDKLEALLDLIRPVLEEARHFIRTNTFRNLGALLESRS